MRPIVRDCCLPVAPPVWHPAATVVVAPRAVRYTSSFCAPRAFSADTTHDVGVLPTDCSNVPLIGVAAFAAFAPFATMSK